MICQVTIYKIGENSIAPWVWWYGLSIDVQRNLANTTYADSFSSLDARGGERTKRGQER